MKEIRGVITAMVTPFTEGGDVDEQAGQRLAAYLLEHGSHGLVISGTTGEVPTITDPEAADLLRAVRREVGDEVLLVCGTGTNDTRHSCELTEMAAEAGADAALVVTPYYNKPNQAGLLEHYRACVRAHPGFPIVVYNVPGRTGGDILPETMQRLCELDEIVAIKEATASMIRAVDIREKCGARLTMLSGDDFTVAPFVACGGEGVISVSSNVAPRLMADLVEAARRGERDRALELQVRLNALHRLLFIEPNPIPVKWALHLMGMFGPEIRLPLVPLGEPHRIALATELRRLGLLS
jgi:4-hydroxy-tetrahydrodipicolinate synthase